MFTFTPLDGCQVIATVQLTLDALHEMRCTLQRALDYNPRTATFARAMEPARPILGDDNFERWIAGLKKIETLGETDDHINFMFEDWISSWRVSDFIENTWTVALVSQQED